MNKIIDALADHAWTVFGNAGGIDTVAITMWGPCDRVRSDREQAIAHHRAAQLAYKPIVRQEHPVYIREA